jgi:hypothetical protein
MSELVAFCDSSGTATRLNIAVLLSLVMRSAVAVSSTLILPHRGTAELLAASDR